MEIKQLWPCNLLIDNVEISDEDNLKLVELAEKYAKKYPHHYEADIVKKDKIGYNFLNEDHPVVKKLERYVKTRTYTIMKSEGFIDPFSYDLECLVTSWRFEPGKRANPHTHGGCDYVGVYYADLDVNEDTGSNFLVPKSRLVMVDPISMRSRALNHNQNFTIIPRPKLFVMHPSYLFHTSEPYEGTKPKTFFVFMIKVIEKIQMPYYKKI